MSTSTIEKILQSLQATSQEKKRQLETSYKEKSVWLQNEFEVIKKLIQQNPREACLNKAQTVLPTEDQEEASSSSAHRDSSLDGKKRKSPETVNTVKLSPQQKRTSVDVDDLIAQAGLPSNLNRLTKEQLLSELKKFGCTSHTKQALKPQLVDALRDAVLAKHNAKLAATGAPSTENVAPASEEPVVVPTEPASAAPSSEMVLSTPSKPAAIRRGSQMADIRNIVTQQSAVAGPAASAPAIESEFLARQNRHRESVARKSLAVLPIAVEAPEPQLPPPAPVTAAATAPPATPSAPKQSQEKGVDAPPAVRECIYPEDGVWMEVSSPARPPAAEASEQADEAEPVPVPVPGASELAGACEPCAGEEGGEEARTRSESDASFVSCISAASAVPGKTAAAASAGGARSSVASTASQKSVGKPASSEAAKTASTSGKPIMPLVHKAKMTAQPTTATTAAAGAVVPSFKKKDAVPAQPATKPATAPVPSASAPPSTTAAPAPAVKKGIFGFLTNKKPNPAAPAPSSTAVGAAPAPAPVAPPAMVDAIIKSARVDAVAAANPSPSVSAPAPSTVAKPAAPEALRVQTPPDVKEAIAHSQLLSSANKATPGAGAPLKDAFASKNLLSSIVSNYNNALKSGNNAVHGPGGSAVAVPATVPAAESKASPVLASAPAAPAPAVLRDITPGSASMKAAVAPAPASVSVAVAAPAPVEVAPPAKKEKEYIIEDRDSDSGTDGEEDPEVARKKQENIPDWARGPLLKEALERQYGLHGQPPVDPDLIFPEVSTCSLEEIFGMREGTKSNKKFSSRSSSAHWDADQMTLVEKRAYRKHMGYDRGLMPTVAGAMK